MQARMKNPAVVLPGIGAAVGGLFKAMHSSGVSQGILDLVHLRASQINGCSSCVHNGSTALKKNGETDERLWAVAAWREAPFFSDAERAALALTEAMTRIADQADPVPDDVYDAAATHFDEQALAAIVLTVAATNLWTRVNVATRQVVSAA
jgi:AhpD family alkylhydroperoxidase